MERFEITCSGKNYIHDFGTGFMFREKGSNQLFSNYNLSLVAKHASTEVTAEGTKDTFHEIREQTLSEILQKDLLPILGVAKK